MYYPNIGSFGETIEKMAIVRDRAVFRKQVTLDAFDLQMNDEIVVGECNFDESA
jgi:hypothetical protein